jgi:hypothetical protein
MDPTERQTEARIEGTLRSESDLIRDAVKLVASGGSARVTVAGLRFGDQLLEQAREMAEGRGVRVVPSWSADEVGVDLVVERVDPPGAP